MSIGRDFSMMARSGSEPKITETPKITYEGQTTFVKYCETCQAHYPHIRAENHTECAVCGTRTERSATQDE